MTLSIKHNKEILYYLLKFGTAFCLFYFGTLAVIGFSTPENAYSPFVAHYLNFIDPLRSSLLYGAKYFLALCGHESHFTNRFTLSLNDGNGVRMVYSCIGYGVMSFWAAFVLSNTGTVKKKFLWTVCGLLWLWVINVLRIGLLAIAVSHQWKFPFGWDHHTWFNIIAYSSIFGLIYLYDRLPRRNNQLP